jgi:hypothetical protein
MQQKSKVFVGLDTSKLKIAVVVAEDGRQSEVRYFGDIDNTPEAVRRLVTKLSGKYRQGHHQFNGFYVLCADSWPEAGHVLSMA